MSPSLLEVQRSHDNIQQRLWIQIAELCPSSPLRFVRFPDTRSNRNTIGAKPEKCKHNTQTPRRHVELLPPSVKSAMVDTLGRHNYGRTPMAMTFGITTRPTSILVSSANSHIPPTPWCFQLLRDMEVDVMQFLAMSLINDEPPEQFATCRRTFKTTV